MRRLSSVSCSSGRVVLDIWPNPENFRHTSSKICRDRRPNPTGFTSSNFSVGGDGGDWAEGGATSSFFAAVSSPSFVVVVPGRVLVFFLSEGGDGDGEEDWALGITIWDRSWNLWILVLMLKLLPKFELRNLASVAAMLLPTILPTIVFETLLLQHKQSSSHNFAKKNIYILSKLDSLDNYK